MHIYLSLHLLAAESLPQHEILNWIPQSQGGRQRLILTESQHRRTCFRWQPLHALENSFVPNRVQTFERSARKIWIPCIPWQGEKKGAQLLIWCEKVKSSDWMDELPIMLKIWRRLKRRYGVLAPTISISLNCQLRFYNWIRILWMFSFISSP